MRLRIGDKYKSLRVFRTTIIYDRGVGPIFRFLFIFSLDLSRQGDVTFDCRKISFSLSKDDKRNCDSLKYLQKCY